MKPRCYLLTRLTRALLSIWLFGACVVLAEYRVGRTTAAADTLLAADESAWKEAQVVSWGPEGTLTEFRALWNGDALHLRFDAQDRDPWHTMTRRDEHLWEEEVVEIFLDPNRSGFDYYELEISPGNVVCDLRMISPSPNKQGEFEFDLAGLETRVTIQRDAGGNPTGWVATASLPWPGFGPLPSTKSISVPPRPGDRWRFNLFRIDRPRDPNASGARSVSAAWSPTGEPSFHVPRAFRDFVFEGSATGGRTGSAVPASAVELIRAAGNAEDEMVRLRLLQTLATRADLAPAVRAELETLLPIVQEWADGKSRPAMNDQRAAENGYLCRFIRNVQPAALGGPVYPAEPAAHSPLRPLWELYRGRMLIWMAIQSGPVRAVAETRQAYYREARDLLRAAGQAFPANRIIGMYLGQPIPWPAMNPADPQAPAWANLQREAMDKLGTIIRWWIRERQLPDGQFGGGWGDDVEMWRWWAPALIAFEDPEIIAAQERISHGMFALPHMRNGFTSRVTDVEHSNEDSTDTIVPMMHLRPDEPIWQQRALRITELMREGWIGRNQRGFTQFKSIYFSDRKVDESPRRAFDTVYHPTIVMPALLYWQRTGDPALGKLFGEWMEVWLDAAKREENGKPAGILPSSISWPAGRVGVPVEGGKSWWQPFPLNHNDQLYNWPGVTRMMASTLLLTWHMTREERFLAPLQSMAAFVRAQGGGSRDAEPGSGSWVAFHARGILQGALAKYRFLTGDRQYDGLLDTSADGYLAFRLGGDRQALTQDLERTAEAFRSNREGFLSEMRWTDRVLNFSSNYLLYMDEAAPPAPNFQLLYSCLTGDAGNAGIFPLNAVRWRTPPRDLAVLVTDSSATAFTAELFHFGPEPRSLAAEFLLLRPGAYELTIAPADARAGAAPTVRRSFRVTGPRAEVPLELPARQLVRIDVRPSS